MACKELEFFFPFVCKTDSIKMSAVQDLRSQEFNRKPARPCSGVRVRLRGGVSWAEHCQIMMIPGRGAGNVYRILEHRRDGAQFCGGETQLADQAARGACCRGDHSAILGVLLKVLVIDLIGLTLP